MEDEDPLPEPPPPEAPPPLPPPPPELLPPEFLMVNFKLCKFEEDEDDDFESTFNFELLLDPVPPEPEVGTISIPPLDDP